MKPVTPQEYAQDYGVFIADMIVISKNFPAITYWVRDNLPDVFLVWKTNLALFPRSLASITTFPVKGGNLSNSSLEYSRERANYNDEVDSIWIKVTMDLKGALAAAEIDPVSQSKILASFAKLKPIANIGKYGSLDDRKK